MTKFYIYSGICFAGLAVMALTLLAIFNGHLLSSATLESLPYLMLLSMLATVAGSMGMSFDSQD